MDKLACYIGIMAYNEEKAIGLLLDSLLSQELENVVIEKIIVVSSGSTDGTNEVVGDFADRDARIELICEPQRRGKPHAINVFLSKVPQNAIAVVCSADLVLSNDVIEKIVLPFNDSGIGMTTPRPVPVNDEKRLMGAIVHILWDLKHRISMHYPKTGEIIAFRKCFDSIDKSTLVDEAYIEYEVQQRGLKIVYVPDAIVKNKGPETFSDFIKQRKRIYIGHKLLERQLGYKGSTFNMGLLFKAIVEMIKAEPGRIFSVFPAIVMEIYARILGGFDILFKRYDRHGCWEMIKTSKDISDGQGR